MKLEQFTPYLAWISLTIAFIAAALWIKAARVIVKYGDSKSDGTVFIENVDVQATAHQQALWNSRAALTTALAIIVQAVHLAISN